MTIYLGIACAFIALFAWGFGDYFTQKSTRAVGVLKSTFFIGLIGAVGLLPFVYNDLIHLNKENIALLLLLSLVVVFASLFELSALKAGKIAIIEPLIGIELPTTVALSMTLGHEELSALQLILIAIIFIGIVLSVTVHHKHLHYHKRLFERGVILAGIGAIGMGLTHFLVGVSSQEISPLVAIWFAHSLLAIICLFALIVRSEFSSLTADLRKHSVVLIGQGLLTNVAWISYAFSTTLISIAIATAISESFLALAVLLGIFLNKEKLSRHQYIGITLVISGVIALSAIAV